MGEGEGGGEGQGRGRRGEGGEKGGAALHNMLVRPCW